MEQPMITTARLYLRETSPADAEVMFTLNSDPDVLRYTGDEPFASIEEAAAFLANYSDFKRNQMGRWAVVRNQDGAVLGWCGLKKHTDGMVDLGFRLFKKYWNQGYATEASLACLHHGFTRFNLPEIVGRAAPANLASVKVLQKVGMRFSHIESETDFGQDIAIYKITHEDFCRN